MSNDELLSAYPLTRRIRLFCLLDPHTCGSISPALSEESAGFLHSISETLTENRMFVDFLFSPAHAKRVSVFVSLFSFQRTLPEQKLRG
jgi:hypothetical protein